LKRLAYLINLYPPYIVGGNEMLACDIVNAFRSRGYDVHVITAKGPQLDNIPHVHQAFNYSLEDRADIFQGGKALSAFGHLRHHVFDLTTYMNVRRKLQRLQPDLIVIDNLYMASAAPLLAARGLRCPVIAQVADKWMIYLLRDLRLLLQTRAGPQQMLLQAYARLVQPLLWKLGCPDEILSISDFMKRYYVEAGYPAERITPTYLGVDASLYEPRSKPHTDNNDLEIVFAGQLWEGKGPQVLVAALGLLREREPKLTLRLRLIGEGNDRFKQRLRQEISENGLEDRAIFDGFVPIERLAERLRSADIFAFPSVWDEPFSITLPAAMASGAPVIASTTGGTPETFEDGDEGLLIPPRNSEALASAISTLAHDPELRNRLSRAAVTRAQQTWSFDAYIDRLEQHYTDAMERSEGAG
jgi:glycosyltransferase involved in cell wall biosynthesis